MPNNSMGLKVFTESLSESNVNKMFNQVIKTISKESGKLESEVENEFKGIKFGDDLSNQIISELKKAEKNLGKHSYKFSVDLFKGLLDSNGSEEKIKEVFNSFKKELLELDKLKKSIGNDEIFFNIDEKSLDNLIKKQREIIKLNEEIEKATSKRGKTVKQNKLQVAQTDFDKMLSNVKVGVNIEGVEESKKSLKELESILSELTKKELDVDKRSDNKKIKDFIKYYQQYENIMKSSGKKVNEDLKDYYDYFIKSNSNFKKYADEQAKKLELSKNSKQEKVDNKSINNQEQEINKMRESLEKTQATLDEITKKYNEQSSIITELEKKLKVLEGLNDPKIVESEEYKRINEELEKAKNNALEYKNALDEAERTVKILTDNLQAYNTNDVVPREQWENASHVVENLIKQVDELKSSLEESRITSEKLSKDMGLLQQDNESLKNQLNTQKEINESQNKQISNLEKIKARYKEVINQIKELESIQGKAENTLKNVDYVNSFNKASSNVMMNEGVNTPGNFVKFDYLDKVKQKLKETGDEYEKLVKASVYYHQYLKKGGTEKIFDINGNDISEKLKSVYEEMFILSEKNLKSEEENARKILNNTNKELFSSREVIKELEKKLKIEEQISTQKKQQEKQNLKDVQKTNVDSNEKQLKLMNDVYRKRQEIKKQSQQTQEVSEKTDIKNIDDNSNLSRQVYENLEKTIKSVTIAINEKTNAIKAEEVQMDLSVNNEISKLKELEGKLKILKDKFENLFNNGALSKENSLSESLYNNIINDFGIKDTNIQNKVKELSNKLYNISINEIKNGKENNGFTSILDELSNTIIKNTNIISERQGIYDKFFEYFKGLSKIKIPDIVRKDLGKDWDSLRKVYTSKFTTKGNAIGLDSIYQEMSDQFKDIFSGTADETEQFREIVNAIKSYREDVKQVVSLTDDDIDQIYSDVIKRVGEMRNNIKSELGKSINENEFDQNTLDNLNLNLKIDDNLWLTEINRTLDAIRTRVNPFKLDLDINNWTQTIENKITEISSKKIKLDVDTNLLSKENKNSNKKSSSKSPKIEGVSLSGLEYTEEELNDIYEAAKKANTALTDTVKIVEQIKKDSQDKYAQSFIITDDKGNKATVNRTGKYYTGQKIVRDDIKEQKEQLKLTKEQQKEQDKLNKEQEQQLKKQLEQENLKKRLQAQVRKETKQNNEEKIKNDLLEKQKSLYEGIYDVRVKIANVEMKLKDAESGSLNEINLKAELDYLNERKNNLEKQYIANNKKLNVYGVSLNDKDRQSIQSNANKQITNNEKSYQQQKILQEKHAKEVSNAQAKYEDQLLKEKTIKEEQYTSWWEKELKSRVNSQVKLYEEIRNEQIKINKLNLDPEKNSSQIAFEENNLKNKKEEFNEAQKFINLNKELINQEEYLEGLRNVRKKTQEDFVKIEDDLRNKSNKSSKSPTLPTDKNYKRVVDLYYEYLDVLKEIKSLEIKQKDPNLSNEELTQISDEIGVLLKKKVDLESQYNNELDLEYTKTAKIKEVLDAISENKKKASSTNLVDVDFDEKAFVGGMSKEQAEKVNVELARTNALMNKINASKSNISGFETPFNKASVEIKNLNEKLLNNAITLDQYKEKVNKTAQSLNSIVAVLDPLNDEDTLKQSLTDIINARYGQKFSVDDINFTRNQKTGNLNAIVEVIDTANKKAYDLKTTLDGVNGTVIDFGLKPKKFSNNWTKFIDELTVKFRNLGTYLLSFVGFYEVWGQIKQGVTYVRELDTALTEMRKVSNETVSSLKEFQKVSFDIADNVGTTASTIQNSTADWMRLGESIDEATESAKTSNILLNVSEFEDISSATDALVSVSQAYKDFEKIDIVDKMNNIGNNYSIATDGIATALQDSASALTTAGNSLDEAIALVTAGNAVVQDPNSVGGGLRTIALRLTGTEESKEALEELGEEADDVITTASKLRDTIMSATKVSSNGFKGFDIFDENGNYKSTYEILQGIADVYNEIVETDKKTGSNNVNLLLETLAGINSFCLKFVETHFYRTHLIALIA